jgi:tRNA (guanine37-N1)-methyltransferase
MRIDILTLFPAMFESPFNESIIKRAKQKGIVDIGIHDIRDYALNKHRQADDYQYGGGAGMVMMIEPIALCIEKLLKERKYDGVIFLTPDGELLNQKAANSFSIMNNLIILCGHYKGVDQRVRDRYITKEVSIGDYVLSGGEPAAVVFCDSIIRLIPGVLNDETSALSDSFQDGLLSPPVYTRPSEYNGMRVPDVLMSGNDKEIYEWRMDMAVEKTRIRRPDLLNE